MATGSLWEKILAAFRSTSGPALPEPARPSEPTPAATEPPFDFDDERIPEACRDRVRLIRSLVDDLEARAAQRNLVREVVELERLRAAHLPKLLKSYIDIPPQHRAEVFRETGRSASFLLNEQLEKMLDRLKSISAMLARGHLDAFTQNIHFIESRYGSSPFD